MTRRWTEFRARRRERRGDRRVLRAEEALELRSRSRSGASRTGGYVGDHADKLGRVRPLTPDEDERLRREDMDYGRTIFDGSWWWETIPRFLRGRRKHKP